MEANTKNANGLLVDPVSNCNDFDRTDSQLEVWFIFCIMVAGHEATTTARKVQQFFAPMIKANENLVPAYRWTPFAYLTFLVSEGMLDAKLREARTGCYRNYARAIEYIVANNITGKSLRTMDLHNLIKIPSVGLKTASFFIMSTRRDVRMAALDTHLLKYLREPDLAHFLQKEGLTSADVPKSTPSNKELYAKLERIVLAAADAAGMSAQDFDFMVWSMYARAAKGKGVNANMAQALQG